MEGDLDDEEISPSAQRTSFLRSNSLISKFFGKREKKPVYNWVIVTDPENRFTDYTNPFFVQREKTTLAYIAPQYVADKFENGLWCIRGLFPVALALELVGPYGVTEFLPDEVAFLTLLSAVIRVLYFFRLNTDILQILFRQYEFWVLIVSCLLGTFGLMHSFNFDKRCALAVDFLTLGTYAACEDASNKYSKRSVIVRGYVIGTFMIYANLSALLLLIYFGYVPNLVNVEIFFPTFPSSVPQGNQTMDNVSGFTVGSLNITLGLVQAILIYLFKSPYHLNRNELAILQVSLFAKSVDIERHESEEEERMEAGERLRRVLTAGSDSDGDESAEGVGSRASSKGSNPNKVLELTGIDPSKRLYRIAPVRNEFVVAGQPFKWDRKDTLASKLVGEKWSEFCFKTIYSNDIIKGVVVLYSLVYSPVLLMILFGWIPKEVAWISLPGYIFVVLYCNTLNYELLKRILRTSGVKIMIFLMVVGNLGLAFAFNFDARTAGVLFLSLAFFVFVAFSDARIRSRLVSKYALVVFTYVYVSFAALLVCFYINLIVDVDDTQIDPGILSGKNSTLQLTTVGYSLYCLEIVVVFLARNYYSIMFKNGFSALEIRLRYFVQDMKEAVSSPFVESGRVSTFVDPRKLSTLLPNTKARPKPIRLPT